MVLLVLNFFEDVPWALRDQIPTDECVFGFDQRIEPRPVGSGCDIGAIEHQKALGTRKST